MRWRSASCISDGRSVTKPSGVMAVSVGGGVDSLIYLMKRDGSVCASELIFSENFFWAFLALAARWFSILSFWVCLRSCMCCVILGWMVGWMSRWLICARVVGR